MLKSAYAVTRIAVPICIPYSLEKDDTVVFEKEMTPVLYVDLEKINTWAKEDGIPVEREIIQWLTENFVHTLSSDEAEKVRLSKLAKKHKSSFKVAVTLNGSIDYGVKQEGHIRLFSRGLVGVQSAMGRG